MATDNNKKRIQLNYTRILARVLDLKEKEVGKILQGTDLKPEDLYQTEPLLSIAEQMQILENGLALFPDDSMGLKMGRQTIPSAHGPLGYLALSSPNLESALEALASYLPRMLGFVEIWLEQDESWLSCKMRYTVEVHPAIQIAVMEIFILTVQSLVESVTGQRPDNADIELAYPEPAQAKLYSKYFHAPFRFDCEYTAYRFPESLSDTPNITSDHEHFAFAKQQCDNLLATLDPQRESVAEKVKTLLINRPQVLLSEEEAADRLLISVRSLSRRLSKEGTSFRKLRDETLAELAARYLDNDKLSVEVIAELLGYHDSASFRRAFKRWYGVTPKDFRNRNTQM